MREFDVAVLTDEPEVLATLSEIYLKTHLPMEALKLENESNENHPILSTVLLLIFGWLFSSCAFSLSSSFYSQNYTFY